MDQDQAELTMTRNEVIRARRAAGHDIPRAGTLHEMSYCRKCGAGFTSLKPCPHREGESDAE